ncbi:hypothetical protein TVAG_233680 [Trichomonas vaginalis G3]|uniref:Uncharacterized protein n=1 Tax=Trichomonas vaginalis (strain ATCC PRA-98 / G3) TaxID=412133 RepID=A2FLU8_TRIV3|nr:bifunctional inhibitor/lipid-transfer protein/seed storage 2s albumin superfamily protein family [Trichomonas vaginalis G3]EAX94117.1 hypothetical protein TVAG_233680 [Trichomonas vaginalis G3]KAI5512690.1 bifunctional inhibitor/lipid-transfer protein/seed storage 2s albumin superfamily protein family [Trichomonas vaginalis G3]|eukprot:XP_001307047.1 hypothetical protein [Trichomonas vaginalis G3]
MPTPFETVYETIRYTDMETPYETIPMTPFVTFDVTPYSTLEYTSKETPIATIHMSPFKTFVETPYDTLSITPLLTPVETIPMTPKKSPISTSEYTPFITPDKSPIQTPARTIKIEDGQSIVETRNSDNANSESAEKSSQKKYTFMFVGIACFFLLVVIGIVCFALYMRHKNNVEYDSETPEVEPHEIDEFKLVMIQKFNIYLFFILLIYELKVVYVEGFCDFFCKRKNSYIFERFCIIFFYI